MRSLILLSCAAVVGAGAVAPATAQLFGLGKFKVEQTDDRFSTDGLSTYVGRNNRISKKSVAGGMHIDGKGMFVEPIVIRRKADASLVRLGFYVHNQTEHDTAYGSPNRIGVPQRITFLPDGGQPIAIAISDGGSKQGDHISYNTISRSASSNIQESGFADLTTDQFRRIAGATSLAVKIEGSERAVIYNERDVSKSFLTNLRAFNASYVTPTVSAR